MKIMKITGFECCFCKKSIEEDSVDPIDINIVFNEDMINKTGSFQNFYAHFKCLKEKLHESMRGYLIREDED
jgi:hypothetical protein